MGLLSICAGLRFERLRESRLLLAAGALQRLIVLPAVAVAATAFFGLSGAAAGVVTIFAMLPTEQSCCVMTAAMRSDAPAVAAGDHAPDARRHGDDSLLDRICDPLRGAGPGGLCEKRDASGAHGPQRT